MDNIAEGFGRENNKEFICFSGLFERLFDANQNLRHIRLLDTQAINQKLFDDLCALADEIQKMIKYLYRLPGQNRIQGIEI
jgi:hypothetical protein